MLCKSLNSTKKTYNFVTCNVRVGCTTPTLLSLRWFQKDYTLKYFSIIRYFSIELSLDKVVTLNFNSHGVLPEIDHFNHVSNITIAAFL